MKDRLVTVATPAIIYEVVPLLENQRQYAEARGYEHVVVREPLWRDLHPSFGKVAEIQRALNDGCETVISSDADVAFMDHSWQIADLIGNGVWMAGYLQTNWPPPDRVAECPGWKYICAGLTVWRNTPEAREFVDRWADYCINGSPHDVPGSRFKVTWHPYEQWFFDQLCRLEYKYEGIRACTAHEIGCFSRELWNDGTIWQEGFPTVHFAGTNPWADRRQTFIDFYAKLVRR